MYIDWLRLLKSARASWTGRRYASLVLCVCLCGLSIKSSAQSRVMEDLRKSDLARRTIALYPSTIRMINLPKLESYYKAVKYVKKGLFFPLREKFTEHDFLTTRARLEDEEGFEAILQIDNGSGDTYQLLYRKEKEETVVLARRDSRYYMGSLFGKIDLLQLVALQGELKDPAVMEENPLLNELFNTAFGRRRGPPEDDEGDISEQPDQSEQSKT